MLLTTEGLGKSFGGVEALRDVSIEVRRGRVTALIGPNGSGKSTLINVISGIYPPDRGRVVFEGRDITGMPPHAVAELGIVRTFQVPRVFRGMSVIENMLVAAKGEGLEGVLSPFLRRGAVAQHERRCLRRAREILEFLEIDHMRNEYAGSLSGGQQKLLALARALMAEPRMLLLDEPVAGVAPALARKIFEKILELRSRLGFLIVEHNMDVLLDFADHVYVLHRGEIVAEGTPEEVLSSRQVLEVYFGE
ncbi:MAG: ABC transporter ATP-binding protein [Euryarchaeota archaeon]|nr:ABC transporter ATP-binding protein [Euryarchaeota archaeon]